MMGAGKQQRVQNQKTDINILKRVWNNILGKEKERNYTEIKSILEKGLCPHTKMANLVPHKDYKNEEIYFWTYANDIS